MILTVSKIAKSYDGTDVLRDVSFTLSRRGRIGITGINGAGKTTLLDIITGKTEPDHGSVSIDPDITPAYLPQEPEIDSELSIYDEVLSSSRHILEMENSLQELREKMSSDSDPGLYELYSHLTHEYEAQDGYSLRSRAVGILRGLGFSEDEFEKKVSLLSGGQKTRLLLASLLFRSPKLLILDEPTNHLDIPAVTWLEEYLSSMGSALIIVSHDRYFLDRTVSGILDIENGSAVFYPGDYTFFSAQKAKIRASMMKAYLENQAELSRQRLVIAKLKSFNREKSVKRARSREKALERMKIAERPAEVHDSMRLSLKPRMMSGSDVLFADDITQAFGGLCLFREVSLSVRRGEKIGIIGPNGSGKTTFLKILASRLIPDEGEVEYGAGVIMSYYDQEYHELDPSRTVLEEISDEYPSKSFGEIRNFLASFLFTGDDVMKYIAELSGGEKGRLSLAKLMLGGANLLLLDEPTNHLDMPSRDILEEALRQYEGTVIFVSHDRYFTDRIATRLLVLRDSVMSEYQGNYSYYLEKRSDPHFSPVYLGSLPDDAKEASSPTGEPPGDEKSAEDYTAQKARKQKQKKLARDIESAEKSAAEREEAIREIEREMALPDYATDPQKLFEMTRRIDILRSEAEHFYTLWEELSGEAEKGD